MFHIRTVYTLQLVPAEEMSSSCLSVYSVYLLFNIENRMPTTTFILSRVNNSGDIVGLDMGRAILNRTYIEYKKKVKNKKIKKEN